MDSPYDELPVHLFSGPAELEDWLDENHESADGVWLKIAKKGAPEPSVTYGEALEVALCFGWIDSQKRGLDETHFLQRFTPRRPRGRWSKINREKAEALIETERMRPAGLAQVEAAKADGRWEAAYEGQGSAKVPPDLQVELDANPAAAKFFASLDGANRYAILYRLDEAKKPETRERRLRKFVGMLERGEKIHE
ncbi:MAG TPA: YdeI/OmpD-associated family protein [Solirubrobacterales bacterium]|nr:YdeI/OmpD-associated family protein [Solirubrobacterales bacterium]